MLTHLNLFFKTLGDPNRLTILALLLEHERCVCEITPVLGISQPAVSQHLRRLAHLGLILEEKRAPWVYYRINKEHVLLKEVLHLIPASNIHSSQNPCSLERSSHE